MAHGDNQRLFPGARILLLYSRVMWPFRRRREKKEKKPRTMEKVIAGVIIGTAISSIVGKKLLEKHAKDKKAREE